MFVPYDASNWRPSVFDGIFLRSSITGGLTDFDGMYFARFALSRSIYILYTMCTACVRRLIESYFCAPRRYCFVATICCSLFQDVTMRRGHARKKA